MPKFIRNPSEIEAEQWLGNLESLDRIQKMGAVFVTQWQGMQLVGEAQLWTGVGGAQGLTTVPVGHWIAKAAVDDYYPIEPGVFQATYRPC